MSTLEAGGGNSTLGKSYFGKTYIYMKFWVKVVVPLD
jgi:hypothetical protein